jgi:DNA-binding transcriptional ArsR family regulator
MGSIGESDHDPFSLESLRLPATMIGDITIKRRPPRHRPGDPFIKGPIAYAWIASACRLPGSGLPVAMAYRLHAKRFRFSHGRHWGMGDIARGLRISLRSARRGLRAAELAGLLSASREPGRKPAVSILDLAESSSGPSHRPLYGPIPWAWWLPASRLPGKAPQVAAVCWLLAGWERSADFELALDGWAEFGLSRFSASRGLDTLERAGLVSAVRRPGRSPIVTIRDPTAGPGPVESGEAVGA